MSSPLPATVSTGLIRITVNTVTEGQNCQNSFDYVNGVTTPPSSADLLAAIAAWDLTFNAAYRACLSPKTFISQYFCAELHFGVTQTQIAFFTLASRSGTAGATNLPLEVGATISRYGDIKGKHGRGRITMPAVPDTFVTPAVAGSVLNAGALTAYGSFATDMMTAFVSGPYTWLPVISVRPTPPNVLVLNATRVVSAVTRPILGTQRRRKIGRGI